MASSGHSQYGAQQAMLPGSVPQGYYATPQPHMIYSYEDMSLLQQRLPVPHQLQSAQQISATGTNPAALGSAGSHFASLSDAAKYTAAINAMSQQPQMAAAHAGSGMYLAGHQGAYPYMMYQYAAPQMMPGVPAQYGQPGLFQYPSNVPVPNLPPQYAMQPKMVLANPSVPAHPYYEAPLPQDLKTGTYAAANHGQTKIMSPRVNSAPEISAGIKSQINKAQNPQYNPVGVPQTPYAPMIISPLAPGAAHSAPLIQHQVKPKY